MEHRELRMEKLHTVNGRLLMRVGFLNSQFSSLKSQSCILNWLVVNEG